MTSGEAIMGADMEFRVAFDLAFFFNDPNKLIEDRVVAAPLIIRAASAVEQTS